MRVYKKMRPLGILLWFTGCARLHKDGDGFTAVFRIWHPLTWLVAICLIVPCALMGEKLSYVVPTQVSLFWKQYLDQLQWVTPFTDVATLKPFKSNRAAQPIRRDMDEATDARWSQGA